MSYLMIVIIGVIAAWAARQFAPAEEHPTGIDLVAGAVGACALVLVIRLAGSPAMAGYFIGTLLSIVGGIAAMFAARYVMKPKLVPVRARSRR